jgi:hypothetical protein
MAGDYLLSVSAFRPKHLSLFSPTGDLSKPGTGTTLLFYGGGLAHTRNHAGRPDQSSTRRNRRFTLNALGLCPLVKHNIYLFRLVKRSPALQACNRMRNSQADGAPKALAPGTKCLRSLFPLDAGVMP